jgi:hypothetical protein
LPACAAPYSIGWPSPREPVLHGRAQPGHSLMKVVFQGSVSNDVIM